MKVFITGKIPVAAKELLLKEGFDVSVYTRDNSIPSDILMKKVRNVDAVISLLTEKFSEDIIAWMQRCKIIANYAVGFNNIDLKAAKEKGIIVTNTPDILTNATADITMSLVLACARNIIHGSELIKSMMWKGWRAEQLLGIELNGKTFGIAGAGRIGTAVAVRAKSFGTKIIYYNRSKNSELEKLTGAKKVSLNKLVESSDVISLHLPLTPATFHIIDKDKINRMKKNAVLVNTARGEIVDESELIKALKAGKLFSAGFDVYTNEPNINKELYKLKNVVLLPHIGSATFEARNGMAILAAQNVINVLQGKKPLTPVC
ncbi:MAG: D-glycerate dehydrogenase [Ignavibacteriales bacterium]|nr:MAG: D-glycerate dehydrogenase [Ignavibacteriales bacterium]